MSTPDIVGIVIAVILLGILAVAAVRIVGQHKVLRERFGDEYDFIVTEKGGRAAAEAELRRRQRRHDTLQLRELSPAELAGYRARWTEIQARFIEDPAAAVHGADRLVSRIVADRGYPVVDFPDRVAHLSVEHATVLANYRDAHEVSVRNDAGQATTEELRLALVNYRTLVGDLIGAQPLVIAATPADV